MQFLELADWDWMLGVNLFGVIYGIKFFLPRMLNSGEPCHIVNTASLAGHLTGDGAPYSPSKFAVVSISEALNRECFNTKVGVSCLCPVGIKSNISESSYTRPKELENTGYNTNEKTIEFMRHHYSFGIEPEDLAKILKKGIENEQLIILPF